jgi:hypothetical protein
MCFVWNSEQTAIISVYSINWERKRLRATGWTVRGSNPGGGEIFRTRPDRPWGLPSLLYNEYRVSFPGIKRPGRGVDHPPSSSARVKERVELYLYSPSGPSWPVLGRILPLHLPIYVYFFQVALRFSCLHQNVCGMREQEARRSVL